MCGANPPRGGMGRARERSLCQESGAIATRTRCTLAASADVFARCGKQVAKNYRRGTAQTPTPAGPGDCFIGRLFIKAEVGADKGYREERKINFFLFDSFKSAQVSTLLFQIFLCFLILWPGGASIPCISVGKLNKRRFHFNFFLSDLPPLPN